MLNITQTHFVHHVREGLRGRCGGRPPLRRWRPLASSAHRAARRVHASTRLARLSTRRASLPDAFLSPRPAASPSQPGPSLHCLRTLFVCSPAPFCGSLADLRCSARMVEAARHLGARRVTPQQCLEFGHGGARLAQERAVSAFIQQTLAESLTKSLTGGRGFTGLTDREFSARGALLKAFQNVHQPPSWQIVAAARRQVRQRPRAQTA